MAHVLDAGPLIAYDRGERRMMALFARADERASRFLVPSPVLAQVWRDGRRQARLASLFMQANVEVLTFNDLDARAVGQILRVAGTADVVDGAVVWSALSHKATILTTDPRDLRRLHPSVGVQEL